MSWRRRMSAAFEWNPPASEAAIRQAERDHGGPLPADYIKLVRIANGGCTDGNLSILDVEDSVQRNMDYDVGQCLPGYFMIGDDGGGTAILIRLQNRRIYEADMGVMGENEVRLSARSLDELLELGTSLIEREEPKERAD